MCHLALFISILQRPKAGANHLSSLAQVLCLVALRARVYECYLPALLHIFSLVKTTLTQSLLASLQYIPDSAITMSRFFSSSAAKAVEKWFGHSRDKLTPTWKTAIEKFTEPGGSAEQRLGKIKSVTIKYVGPESS